VNSRRVATRLATVLAVGAAALALASCGSSSSNSSSSSKAAAPSSAYAGAGASTTATGATAPTVSLATTSLGPVLVDGGGRTLYEFEKDGPGAGTSACYGACARAWAPVLSAVTPNPSSGLNARLLATLARTDGARQVSYGGHPLYTFARDTAPGSTKGEGSKAFGADWYMVGATGKKVEKAGP
jgi:predicted lipoprotein with Yx(FWY)xxD motif